ncbi:single-stranded DNA-binding protein [Candidatus Babeliales bacterium]|nr:single-stranded DNA-binding protein [Candidatus Babeliales bacterium]
MASFNRVVMMGNLTRDPDYKQLSSGQGVCRLGIASNRQFKNRQTGAMVQEVCFVDVDVWGPQAESCRQYLQKGRGVLIEGRLKFDTWQDQDGNARNKHSIVADRVIFMAATQADETGLKSESYSGIGDSEMEQELNKQINEVKARTKSAQKTSKEKTSGQTQDFQLADEPPFEDDLPF